MGHGSSKELPETTNTEGASTPSSRIKRPHIRRIFRRLTVSRGNGSSSSSSTLKLVSAEDFAGIALLTLISADMQQFKDKWLACVSFGEQTFRTHISDQTEKPVWNSEKKLLLEKNGPRLARISVFETNRISKNNLVGYCEIDLLELLTQVKETLLVAGEGRVWCLEYRLVLGGFDWDPTLQEKACWSRRPFGRVCMPLDKWRGVRLLL